jgi:hypothetical protein
MDDDRLSVFESILPPDKGDMLFRSDKDWANANVSATVADWVYMTGFRRAAHRLSELVCHADSEQDLLIYPIVYLYRHHIELVLKNIFESAFGLLDCSLTQDNRKTLGRHGLLQLWQATRPLLNSVYDHADDSPFPEAELDGIDFYIRQIHEHDPDGQCFRYATTKTKNAGQPGAKVPSLSPNLKLTNFKELSAALGKLASYLECIEWWVSDLEDARTEHLMRNVIGL